MSIGKDMASPVHFRIGNLSNKTFEKSFGLNIVLIGRRTIGAETDIVEAVRIMGSERIGLDTGSHERGNGKAFFSIEKVKTVMPVSTLHDLGQRAVGQWMASGRRDILVEFRSTYTQMHTERLSPDLVVEHTLKQGFDFPLYIMFRNFGTWLAEMEMEDSGYSRGIEKNILKSHRRDTGELAVSSCSGVLVQRLFIAEPQQRKRYSRTTEKDGPGTAATKNWYSLNGTRGYLALGGDLVPALPWLAAMGVCGAGEYRSSAFGEISLWLGEFL
jgi:hypothetical protein